MELLDFARGPALAAALAIMCAGIAWRLFGIFRLPNKPDYSAPRSSALWAGRLQGIVSRMWPHPEFRLDKSLTFHDPCQVSRRGGATQAPREVLKALGVELREMPGSGDLNWCCGGGGGVVTIHRADPLRYKAFGIKMRQIDATGADMAVTSCANCRQTFDDGQAHFKWDKTMGSLLETVAANLAEEAQ